MRFHAPAIVIALAMALSGLANAAITVEEAKKLGTTLTAPSRPMLRCQSSP